jgi:hypothetical protein
MCELLKAMNEQFSNFASSYLSLSLSLPLSLSLNTHTFAHAANFKMFQMHKTLTHHRQPEYA